MKVCYFCGKRLDDRLVVYRNSECPYCGKDLKICYNCKFYREGAHWDCLETIKEPVREKDRANFCEYFVFKETSEDNTTKKEVEAKDKFKKLFGD